MTNNKGVFNLIPNKILARIVDDDALIITNNGEKFIGLYGDFEIWDANGDHYFMRYDEFLKKYQPDNEIAFDIITNKTKESYNISEYKNNHSDYKVSNAIIGNS